jgi:hypothetical protein
MTFTPLGDVANTIRDNLKQQPKGEPIRELVHLRISLARIAQATNLEEKIPGIGNLREVPFTTLDYLARTEARGWNALAAAIVDRMTLR